MIVWIISRLSRTLVYDIVVVELNPRQRMAFTVSQEVVVDSSTVLVNDSANNPTMQAQSQTMTDTYSRILGIAAVSKWNAIMY
jgi:hypothetical protein